MLHLFVGMWPLGQEEATPHCPPSTQWVAITTTVTTSEIPEQKGRVLGTQQLLGEATSSGQGRTAVCRAEGSFLTLAEAALLRCLHMSEKPRAAGGLFSA